MDEPLKRHKLSKLTQEEIGNLNSPKSIKAIDFVVKSLPTKKTPCPEVLLENVIEHLKKS